jgi:hypothetical protein
LLAGSLPTERFAAIFATEEFIHLIRSALGAGPLDERSKILLKKAEQYTDNRLMNISRSILVAQPHLNNTRNYSNSVRNRLWHVMPLTKSNQWPLIP